MPRPRKDYIVLDDTNATVAESGASTWQIKPHMYNSWRPGDEMTMKLISASVTAINNTWDASANPNIKFYGNFTARNQYNETGESLIGVVNSYTVIIPILTVDTTFITARRLEPTSPELYCDRLSNLKITARTDVGSTTAFIDLDTYTTQFMFEIKYYSRDE